MRELKTEKNQNVTLKNDVNRLQLQVDEAKKLTDYLEGELSKEKERAETLQSKTLEQMAQITTMKNQNFTNIDESQRKYDELQQ